MNEASKSCILQGLSQYFSNLGQAEEPWFKKYRHEHCKLIFYIPLKCLLRKLTFIIEASPL